MDTPIPHVITHILRLALEPEHEVMDKSLMPTCIVQQQVDQFLPCWVREQISEFIRTAVSEVSV